MKIGVIGCTKGIGKEVLSQAIKQQFDVTVLVRDKTKITDKNISLIEGDFKDYDSVKKLAEGVDVIVVSVGLPPTFSKVNLFSKGTENIIQATKELNVNPLIIAVTGIGAGDSKGHGGFFYDKIMNPLLLKTIYEDKNRQEQILTNQYNNSIIVRPGFLTHQPKTENYKVITDLTDVKAGKISRADVADFILKQAKSPTFLNQTPLITY